MKRGLVVALFLAGAFASAAVAQDQGEIVSLRGSVDLPDTTPAAPVLEQSRPANGFARAYRQQPPLIPHSIDGYQVTGNFNKCMSCHTWPQNAQYGAPKVSETHYSTREGTDLDEISPRRWFCNQCHVPQADASPLVNNAFKNAREMEGAFSQ